MANEISGLLGFFEELQAAQATIDEAKQAQDTLDALTVEIGARGEGLDRLRRDTDHAQEQITEKRRSIHDLEVRERELKNLVDGGFHNYRQEEGVWKVKIQALKDETKDLEHVREQRDKAVKATEDARGTLRRLEGQIKSAEDKLHGIFDQFKTFGAMRPDNTDALDFTTERTGRAVRNEPHDGGSERHHGED